jgi:hypothetical protein
MHLSRRIAAATAAAALTLTGVATTAVAAQAAPPAHATKAAKPTKPTKPVKAPKADRAVAKVVTAARVLDKGLAAAASSRRLRGIEVASADAIRANVAADRAAVAALVAAVKADPAQAVAALATLRAYRTANYAVAIGRVRTAETLAAYAASIADRVAVEAPEQQAAYDEALVLIDAAHAAALAVTATSSQADVAAISADLDTAEQLLEQVGAALAA